MNINVESVEGLVNYRGWRWWNGRSSFGGLMWGFPL